MGNGTMGHLQIADWKLTFIPSRNEGKTSKIPAVNIYIYIYILQVKSLKDQDGLGVDQRPACGLRGQWDLISI